MEFPRAAVDDTIPARFARVAAAYPDLAALPGYTYGQLDGVTNALACQLTEGPVAIRLPRDREPLAVLSALKAGLPYCVLEDRPGLLEDLQPGTLWERWEDPEPAATGPAVPLRPTDPAAIVYTSGSTGRPRGLVRSHACILHRTWLYCHEHNLGPGDVQSGHHSCRHVAAEADLFGALLSGARYAPFELGTGGWPGLASWLTSESVTLWHPPVALLRRFLHWLDRPLELPHLRLLALAGESVHPADLELFRARVRGRVRVEHRLSSTETSNIARFCLEPEEPVPPRLAVGYPVPDKEIRLEADGRIAVRSPYLASGYWRGETLPGPWFVTGDRARWAGDRLELLGRADRMVKVDGIRVEPGEIECVLSQQPEVREVAVRPGPAGLTAFVSTSLTEAELRGRAARLLPEAMRPRHWVHIQELPLTGTGKVDRQALTPTEAELLELWRQVLAQPGLGPEDDFFAWGGTSLLAADVCARLPLSPAELRWFPTVRLLARRLRDSGPLWRTRLVPLRRGTGPVWILAHPLAGGAEIYEPLARALGPDRQVYALVCPHAPEPTLPALAAVYAEAIREAGLQGPLNLAGYSFGGYLAWEVGRLLQCRVILLDTPTTQLFAGPGGRLPELYERIYRPWTRLLHHLRCGLSWRQILTRAWRRLQIRVSGLPPAQRERMAQMRRLRAVYSTTPASVEAVVLRARWQPPALRRERYLGWDRLTRAVTALPVPGLHGESLLLEPNVLAVARQLNSLEVPRGATTSPTHFTGDDPAGGQPPRLPLSL